MSLEQSTVVCATCGASIDTAVDTEENRIPCTNCGGTQRHYSDTFTDVIVFRDGIRVEAKHAREKRPFIEELAGPDFSRSKEKAVQKERIIDRDNDRYTEKVTDYESGETIHHCDEPLSQHQGHGSAKHKKDERDEK